MSKNPILMGKEELQVHLSAFEALAVKHLRVIQDYLPDNYKSITLICRTDDPDQQIVLSNKMNIESDIQALKTMKRKV